RRARRPDGTLDGPDGSKDPVRSDRDELLVSGKVRDGDRSIVDDFEKPFRPATMLDVGPPGRADARQIETVAFGNERRLIRAESVRGPSGLLQLRVLPSAAVPFLQRFDDRCEDKGTKLMWHAGDTLRSTESAM